MRSMWGVSIGTKPNEANVLRNVSSIRSRGIITDGGTSRSPLATRGSIDMTDEPFLCLGTTDRGLDPITGPGIRAEVRRAHQSRVTG